MKSTLAAVQKMGAAAIAIGSFLAIGGVQAEPICTNGFQRIEGGSIATPYCADELLAKVAREYGANASAKAIRSNPNFARALCRLVGQDIRVKDICDTANPSENTLP
jgi:hypothetical protein